MGYKKFLIHSAVLYLQSLNDAFVKVQIENVYLDSRSRALKDNSLQRTFNYVKRWLPYVVIPNDWYFCSRIFSFFKKNKIKLCKYEHSFRCLGSMQQQKGYVP